MHVDVFSNQKMGKMQNACCTGTTETKRRSVTESTAPVESSLQKSYIMALEKKCSITTHDDNKYCSISITCEFCVIH